MNHLMVDLETLDTKPSTVILSIGAVAFNEDSILDGGRFYARCTWQDQMQAGRTLSESTLRFWMQQNDEARATLFRDQITLHNALEQFARFYRQHNCERAWANGQSFDISILDHAYGYEVPWKYNAPRDMRTLRDLVPDLSDRIPAIGTAHNALDDAIWQAEFTVAALKHLRGA